jgi:hypothetical protein
VPGSVPLKASDDLKELARRLDYLINEASALRRELTERMAAMRRDDQQDLGPRRGLSKHR